MEGAEQMSQANLQRIGKLVRTQDNRCTCNPMFCVQGRRRNLVWIDTYDGAEEVEAPADPDNPPESYELTGYIDVWETLAVASPKTDAKSTWN